MALAAFFLRPLSTATATETVLRAVEVRPILEALHVASNPCFDAATLAPHVAAWLKRSAMDRRIEVEVRGDPLSPAGLALEIRRDGQAVGTRSFPAFTVPCEDVRAAVAVSTALAIDATVLESLGVNVPSSAPSEPAHRAPARSEPQPARLAVATEGVALLGVLPTVAAAYAPSASFTIVPAVALRVSALVTAPSSFAFDGGNVDVSVVAGRLDGCAVVPAGALRLRFCAGLAAGELRAVGTRFTVSTSPAPVPWVAGLGRFDLRIPVTGRLGLVLASDFAVRFAQTSIDVTSLKGTVRDSRPLSVLGAMLGAGSEILF